MQTGVRWPPTASRSTTGQARLRRAVLVMVVLAAIGFVARPGSGASVQAQVGLGTVASFAVLGGQTVISTGPTVLDGDLGVSPGSAITGFPPGLANGTTHAADAKALQAQSDLTVAYNDAAGRAPDANLSGQDLGGKTLTAGAYKFDAAAQLTGTLSLDGQGNPDAVFIFQIGSTLTTATSATVALQNLAQACHVFWQVGSSATLGTTTTFVGNVLALTSITAVSGTKVLDGRLLARNGSVTLDANVVTRSTCAAPATTTTAPPGTITTPTTIPATTTTTAASGATTTTTVASGGGATTTTSIAAPGGGTTTTTAAAAGPGGGATTTTALAAAGGGATTTTALAAAGGGATTTTTAAAGPGGGATTTTAAAAGPGGGATTTTAAAAAATQAVTTTTAAAAAQAVTTTTSVAGTSAATTTTAAAATSTTSTTAAGRGSATSSTVTGAQATGTTTGLSDRAATTGTATTIVLAGTGGRSPLLTLALGLLLLVTGATLRAATGARRPD